jgi:hypothetical protein
MHYTRLRLSHPLTHYLIWNASCTFDSGYR